ncbi:efflux RND transporter periplasmic adaptor subunit [Thioalkalivibrio sp. HL-Eb18]|uniref:efflux RND transporter periplasmic adaptor subunit n=1 Tax=Thioalkalivibrio sp. HL-Eb18 TaxID=1266913 RepID=UPI0003816BE5|nr:efflux RND transporter periplasmic adaptor subunit [Thioalkalivibrio sp. HL-Eb18]
MTHRIAQGIAHRITRIITLLALALATALATGPALADDLEITHWGAELEWFLEAGAPAPGATETFVVHATWLDDFRPVTTGEVTLQMHNRYGEIFSEATAGLDREGIFAVPLTLPAPGRYYLTAVHEDADGMRESTLGQVHVPGDHDQGDEDHGHDHDHDHAGDDRRHAHGEDDHGDDHGHDDHGHDHGHGDEGHAHDADDTITFLKETQWRMRFATAPARYEPFAERIEVPGTIREVPGKRTRLIAPADGVITADGEWPAPGREVNAGDSLMRLAVLPDSGTSSGLALDLARAQERLTAAEADLERLTALAEEGVIADSRVVEARRERNTARAELDDARDRQERLDGSAVSGTLALRAPAGGRVESLDVSPGEVVQAGQQLARVLDGETLWLVAHLYPADLERVTSLADPAMRHPGSREWHAIGGEPVWEGGAFDGPGQTLPVAFALEDTDTRYRPGMPLTVSLAAGPSRHRVTLPAAALIDDDGVQVVMVQTGGETFERRPVRTGIRSAGRVEILAGVEADERVVVQGAYAVLLAGRDTDDIGHGHSH